MKPTSKWVTLQLSLCVFAIFIFQLSETLSSILIGIALGIGIRQYYVLSEFISKEEVSK